LSAKGLEPEKADNKEAIVWKWTVASTIKKGAWPVEVCRAPFATARAPLRRRPQ